MDIQAVSNIAKAIFKLTVIMQTACKDAKKTVRAKDFALAVICTNDSQGYKFLWSIPLK